jgi:hypothetical protein
LQAIRIYRARFVRDTKGGLDVDGRRIRARFNYWLNYGYPFIGALFVRASAESK